MTRFDSSCCELVAPVGFEPYVAGVKGRLPYQLEEGTKSIRFVITDKAFATINSVCTASFFYVVEVRGATALLRRHLTVYIPLSGRAVILLFLYRGMKERFVKSYCTLHEQESNLSVSGLEPHFILTEIRFLV